MNFKKVLIALGVTLSPLALAQAGKVIEARGGLYGKICTPTNADYTLLGNDGCSVIQFNTGTPNRTLSLGSAAGHAGRVIYVKKMNTDLGTVTITGTGGIDGSATAERNRINYNQGSATVYSDGTSWRYAEPITEHGSFAPTASTPVNLDSTPTCSDNGRFSRVGNVVTYGWRCATDVTNNALVTTYRVTIPIPTANWASSDRVYGSCVTDIGSSANIPPTVWQLQSVTGGQTISLETNQSTQVGTTGRSVICKAIYILE